jgi:hypothetical protein
MGEDIFPVPRGLLLAAQTNFIWERDTRLEQIEWPELTVRTPAAGGRDSSLQVSNLLA